ncbi:unnamed protein product [Durusdinium trenchii]|uniref:Cyclic nucleotide-binding domain-containing protein n=1 Tax=Durusdinium trenchii TaxID=1381693 RepID=A0ABP0PIE0_9DINO
MAKLLESLQRLEEELHKAIQEVRTQVRELDGPDDKPEQIEEAATTSVDIFQQEPPAVMEQVMRDWPGTIKPEMTIRAKQHAAILHETENSEQLNLQLSPHFMELSMRSGGVVNELSRDFVITPMSRSSRVDLDLLEAQQPSWGVVRPHSRMRISWDLVGTCLILLDVIILPLSLAWGFETEPMRPAVTVEEAFLAVFAWLNLLFWPADLLLNFNTAFYMCHGNRANATSASPDATEDAQVMAITTSFSNDTESGYLRSLRSARYLRALRSIRILRIVKSRRVNVMIENWVIGLGQQWLILAFNVCRMLASILLTAHLLACSWFAVGTAVSGFRESWIDLAEIWPEAGHVQYIHALSWVVQPPSVPESRILGSGSFEERLVSILMVVVTVLIIGSSLSILTGTLQEIRTINNERSRKRRELRTYLHSRAAPTELVMRIMSFADYKLERHSPVTYDSDLISPLLDAELAVWQKGHIMRIHPTFDLVSTAFPKVFADICCALQKQLYYEGESAFLAGLLAESMHITSHGAFVVYDAHGEELERYNNKHEFFSEVALYVETVMHDSTLQIESFAEVYTLSGTDVATILLHSPICAGMFVEYAKEFVATYAKTAVHHQKSLRTTLSRNLSVASWKLDMNCAHRALKVNSFYMDLHLHKEKVLQNVRLSGSDVGADPVKPTAPEEADTLSEQMTPKRSQASKASGSEVGTMPLDGDLWHNWPLDSDLQHEAAAEKQEREEVPHLSRQLVKSIMQGQALDVEDLQEAFLELHPERGLHNMYSQQNEMEKAICSCYCLAALVADDYETYTEPQQDAAKLHRSQWEQLRSILHWAAPTEDMLEAAFFLLAVRSIGKCRAVTRQLPPESQKPEEALLAILNNYTNMVPSFERLSPSGQSMVVKSMQLQRGFSFPQMLQGENVPANLMQLRHFLDENGGAVILKFYVVFLLGFLSALQGGHGSLFMTHSNAKNIYLGLSTVQYVLEKEPGFLYWTYIYQRGTLLKRVARTSQDLAILRLACLCRARNGHDYDELQKAYHELDEHQRNVLTSHFLPSGIKSSAIVFEFLPLCLENAKKNPHVSVPGLLDVLVSLIEATWASSFSHKITTIDLSNLAGFILVLQNPFVFQTCLSRSKLRLIKDQDYQLDLTEENWNRVNEKPTDVSAVAYAVRDILHQQKQNANPFVSM